MARKRNRQGGTFGYQDARLKLLHSIVDEDLVGGDLLPSIRSMADRFTEGRLKPVRMAVEGLVADGVLESQHGRGVFVRDEARARELLTTPNGTDRNTSAKRIADEMSPFAFRGSRRVLRVAICEIDPDLRSAWDSIIDSFNAAQEGCRVQPHYYRLSDPNLGEIFAADIVQIQAHNRQRIPASFEALDVGECLGRNTLDRFLPSLYPVSGISGLPVTAVAHCAVVNKNALGPGWPDIPDAWASLDGYVDFILNLRKRASKHVKAIVYAFNNFLFHLSLSGLAGSAGIEELPDFTSAAVRDMLTRFGRVYCRADCYAGDWSRVPVDPVRDVWVRETHTYDAHLIDAGGRIREFVPLPTERDGRVPIISHLFCINARSALIADGQAFLEHLASDAVMDRLLSAGHISGRRDAGPRLHHVIAHSLAHGRLIEDACPRLLDMFALSVTPEVDRWQNAEISLEELCERLEGARQTALQQLREAL